MGKRRTVDNRYLHRRRRGWYIRVAVPPSLVPVVGQTHKVRSLKTRDVSVARERRWQALAAIKAELAEHRGGTEIGHWLPASFDPIQAALEHRDWLTSASDEPHDPNDPRSPSDRDIASSVIHDYAEEIEQKRGYETAKTYHRVATTTSPVLAEVGRRWLEEIQGSIAEQTLSHHRYALRLFQEAFPKVVSVDQADRRLAGRFVSDTLLRSGKAQRTVNRIIASLAALWKWMIKRGLVESNPWTGQGDYSRKKKAARAKRPFNAEELQKLLEADPVAVMGKRYGAAIADLLRLGLMTGARLNEMCELRVEDVLVKDRAIRVREGKTESAKRIIPVHDAVWPLIERRLEEAQDGQLFPELKPGGPDKKRSWYTSKRLTLYRRRVLGDNDTVDFHSLRRDFATYLERAQGVTLAVNPSVIAELMGHEKSTLALSAYSGGLRLEALRNAVSALEKVMEPEVLAAL
jgi:integrase